MRDTSNNAADEVESRHEKQRQDESLHGKHVRSVLRPMRTGLEAWIGHVTAPFRCLLGSLEDGSSIVLDDTFFYSWLETPNALMGPPSMEAVLHSKARSSQSFEIGCKEPDTMECPENGRLAQDQGVLLPEELLPSSGVAERNVSDDAEPLPVLETWRFADRAYLREAISSASHTETQSGSTTAASGYEYCISQVNPKPLSRQISIGRMQRSALMSAAGDNRRRQPVLSSRRLSLTPSKSSGAASTFTSRSSLYSMSESKLEMEDATRVQLLMTKFVARVQHKASQRESNELQSRLTHLLHKNAQLRQQHARELAFQEDRHAAHVFELERQREVAADERQTASSRPMIPCRRAPQPPLTANEHLMAAHEETHLLRAAVRCLMGERTQCFAALADSLEEQDRLQHNNDNLEAELRYEEDLGRFLMAKLEVSAQELSQAKEEHVQEAERPEATLDLLHGTIRRLNEDKRSLNKALAAASEIARYQPSSAMVSGDSLDCALRRLCDKIKATWPMVNNQGIQDMEDQLHALERLKGRASADCVGTKLHADANRVEPVQHWRCTDDDPPLVPKQTELPNEENTKQTQRVFGLPSESA